MADPKTGLPYDNSEHGEFTSVSNIGMYLTSVIAARDLGFITAQDADRRLDRTLEGVEKLKTWNGLQQCWNSVKTLEPAPHDTAISLLDSGNFAAALITVAQAAPKFQHRCNKLLSTMKWEWFYDPDRGLLRGGFDTAKGKFIEGWYLDSLGTDAQLCQFLAIAAGQAPPQMWDKLQHELETRYDVSYLKPGWHGGGLFMQYISGLWLDERGTPMRRSAENFAYAQMLHAEAIGSPVWGWSASAAPDGQYLGWGKLRDEVVTPHACVLALERFPAEVVANLKALEKLGARTLGNGFVDSVDWKSGQRSKTYLMLDQSMLLISLANFLDEHSVREWFQKHPLVREGRARMDVFHQPTTKAHG